jgi:glycosyltransferase involved in cell wall biosynthesis
MKLSKNAHVLILSHFYKRTTTGGGPPQEIRDFFLSKVKSVVYIEHPFPGADDYRSSFMLFERGVLKKQIFSPPLRGPKVLFYISDIFLTFCFVLLANRRFDLCIALDNLNTFSVVPFRKLGIVNKLVFYTIDYTLYRFKNKTLNSIYHIIDRIACYHADSIWVLSERVVEGRKQNKVDTRKTAPSILLPMGANLKRINIPPFEEINRHDIIFVGYLTEKQGVQLVLAALPKVIAKVPTVRFNIVGQDEYEKALKEQVKKLKIENYVVFKGFVKDYSAVESMVRIAAIGVAPYVPSKDTFTIYGDPGKVKLYLGCGLPVVITDVPAIARVIAKEKAGILIEYSEKSIAEALIQLLTDDTLYKKYRKNAKRLAKQFDTDSLIQKALEKIS